MGNVKRGANTYQVLVDVPPNQMQTAFAALGNTIMFYRKASTTLNAVSATQSYANNNNFPSYGGSSSPCTAGQIVTIAGLAAEVDVAVLSAANTAPLGGGGGSTVTETATLNVGVTSYTTTATPAGDVTTYRNGFLIPSTTAGSVVSFDVSGSNTSTDDYTFLIPQ